MRTTHPSRREDDHATNDLDIGEDYQVPVKCASEIEKLTLSLANSKPSEEEPEQYRQDRIKAALAEKSCPDPSNQSNRGWHPSPSCPNTRSSLGRL